MFELIGEGKLVSIKKRRWDTCNTTIVMLPKLRLLQERASPADAPRRGRHPKNCMCTKQVAQGLDAGSLQVLPYE